MEFIEQMVETKVSEQSVERIFFNEDIRYKEFNHIHFDDFSLSIQASFAHYCTPKTTLKDLKEYTSMEFALIREGEFISVSEVAPNFQQLSEIEKYHDTVYAYVPVDLIEELYQFLRYGF